MIRDGAVTAAKVRAGAVTSARLSTLAPEPEVVLVTIPNVELLSVGTWNASTGPIEFTKEDLAAIVAALDDPAIHEPRLRIGHTPANVSVEESAGGFDEQPAFGRFTNLRLENNGTTIVADAVGVPAWLAEIMPSAFPSRSVEAYWGYTTAAGRTHNCVMPSVALLGVSMPACETLEDLQLAFGAEVPEGVEFTYLKKVEASKGEPMPKRVSASVTYTDVRRSFYEEIAEGDQYWWWICDFIMSPSTVIVDDDEGGLWSVPYTISGDAINWGDPVEVRVQYIEVDSGKVAAKKPAAGELARFRLAYVDGAGDQLAAAPATSLFTAASSRPQDRVRAATNNGGGNNVDAAELRASLGLPEDATDEQVQEKLKTNAAAAERVNELETENADLKTAAEAAKTGADGSVVLDTETYEQLKAGASDGADARAEQVELRRASKIDAAIKAGKFPPSRRDHYLALMQKDEDGTTTFIDGLAAGQIPVNELAQHTDDRTAMSSQLEVGLAAAGVNTRKES